jgi:DNA-binding transcriptional regulator YiaG
MEIRLALLQGLHFLEVSHVGLGALLSRSGKGTNMVRSPKELDRTVHSDAVVQEEHTNEGTLAAMPLDALRDARRLTQVQMAQLLKISQGAVSKVERRTDMFVSTLRNYVRAIGGDLEIRAVFPEGDVLIDQFGALKHAPQSKRDNSPRKAAPAL